MSALAIVLTFAVVSVIFAKKARGLRRDDKRMTMWVLIALYLVFAFIACGAVIYSS